MPKSVFTDKYAAFKDLLVELRKSSGLTQIDLAAKLRRPQSFVSKFERGERRLDVVEFMQIAKALGSKASKLLERLEKSKL